METTNCRYCNKLLHGKYPYAVDKKTGKEAKWNYYGGFVCSKSCDVSAILQHKSSMPGAGKATFLNSFEREKVNSNWPND